MIDIILVSALLVAIFFAIRHITFLRKCGKMTCGNCPHHGKCMIK